MSEPASEPDEVVAANPPLLEARAYWKNAHAIGAPGQRDMHEGAELQHQHAEMARTAALLSIAETLDRMRTDASGNGRRLATIANSLVTITKEIAKMRQGRR